MTASVKLSCKAMEGYTACILCSFDPMKGCTACILCSSDPNQKPQREHGSNLSSTHDEANTVKAFCSCLQSQPVACINESNGE